MALRNITNTVQGRVTSAPVHGREPSTPVLRSLFFNGKEFDGLALYNMQTKELQDIVSKVMGWIGKYFDDEFQTWIVEDVRLDEERGEVVVFFAVCRPDDDSDADDASACSEDWGYSTIPLFKKNFAKKLRSHPTKSGPVRSSSSFSSPGLRLRYRRGNMNLDGGGDLLVSVCWRSHTVDDLGGRTLSRAFI